MSKAPTLSSVNGTTLSGAQQKAFNIALVNALNTLGLQEGNRTTITSDTTLTITQAGLVLVDCTGGNVAITLPTSGTTTDDAVYQISRLDNTGNTLTVSRGGSDTIEGSSSSVSISGHGVLGLQIPAGSTDWKIFSRSGRTQAGARSAVGAAASGANSDIQSLSGMTTALSTAQGGTGSKIGPVLRGWIDGLIMSTAGSSATMAIAAGQAADSTNAELLLLSASISKTTSAWAVGSGNGGLDTGSIANNTWYYFYLIRRPDTGVVDVVFSTNSTTPTLPANYTQYRYIGAGLTNGSAQWTSFTQVGEEFIFNTPVADVSVSNPGTSVVTRTMSVPRRLGIRVVLGGYLNWATSGSAFHRITSTDEPDAAPTASNCTHGTVAGAGIQLSWGRMTVRCNASGQINTRHSASGVSDQMFINTLGWYDDRGRNA